MNIVADKYYKFSFVEDFVTLDGIYKVLQLMSYSEIINETIDMVASLYSKVYAEDAATAAWELARAGLIHNTFYKLQSVTDETVIIMAPEAILTEYPNASVDQFCKIMLNIDLGLFANQDDLDTIGQIITEQLHARLGITPNPQILIYDKQWMADVEYDEIEAARVASREAVVNYYSEAVRQSAEITVKDAKIAALEAIIVGLQTS